MIPPQTVIAQEGDICDKILLVVDGKIEFFRKIKECADKESIVPSDFKRALDHRLGVKELMNCFGDSILIKDVRHENPYRIGEENVVLRLLNPFTVISRSWLVVLQLDTASFFKLIQETGISTIESMRTVTMKKLELVYKSL